MKKVVMRLFRRTPPAAMDCHEVGRVLQHYLDGEIDAARARRIEQHLEECRRCGMDAATYRRIKGTLAAQRPELPSDSVERLREFGIQLTRRGGPAVERYDV